MVLGSAGAFAADLPLKAPVMAPPVFSWTGCYVGGHVGAGAMHDSFTDENGNGGLAGGQVGCNYQDGNTVFGIEGEGYWSGIKASSTFAPPIRTIDTAGIISGNNGFGYNFTDTAKNKNDFSIAARAGIAFDRTLVYGKAGWVWGSFDFDEAGFFGCCGTFHPTYSLTKSGTLDGLLLGVGIEHAFTRNWTVKMEYNYLNFGSKAMAETFCTQGVCQLNGSFSDHATKQIFKVGANYLFNMAGPKF
ncbi:MAG TPA: outer membrane beta-barrel protein [Bryobacteraceae bacterium]|nr:outer membrane beta-barrel protein [Bryobacteraceae bacterium]